MVSLLHRATINKVSVKLLQLQLRSLLVIISVHKLPV